MSQIIRKFVEDNAINGVKIRLDNNQTLRARNAGDTADVDILKVDASDVLQVLRAMGMNNTQISNLADPTADQDAVNKRFLVNYVQGVKDPKDAARVASTADMGAATYDNGTGGVGATLTADANGALGNIDGVGLSVGDRILLKNQTAGEENGIYAVTQLGDVGTPWILTRATDADDNSGDGEVTQGMLVPVAEGTLNGGLGFMLTTPDPITIGTTSLSFTQFGEVIVAGQGLSKTGQTLAVKDGAGLGFDGSDNLEVNVDDATLVDGTTKIVSDNVVGKKSFRESFTLSGTDITNGYVDLAKVASRDSLVMQPDGGPRQNESLDFTLSYTGGAGSKTRLTWAGDLVGAAALAANDVLYIQYDSLDY